VSPSERYAESGSGWRLRERDRAVRAGCAVLITAATLVAGVPALTSPAADLAAPAASTVSAGTRPGPGPGPGTQRPSAVAMIADVLRTARQQAPPPAAAPPPAVAAPAAVPRPAAVSAVDARGQLALRFALAQRGKPYAYGGTGPNAYDCSGLVQRAWAAAGVKIPRTTYQQAHTGKAVALSAIKAGDLVIFYADASHVGIYAGNGQVVVAPHVGEVVQLQQMKWMPINTVRRPG